MLTGIKEWILNSARGVLTDNTVYDIHIDQLYEDLMESREDILLKSCEIFDLMCKILKDENLTDLSLDLFVDLESYDDFLNGKCSDLNTLISGIEIKAMPVIMLHRKAYGPLVDGEYYKVPLLFTIYSWSYEVSCIYQEYRSLEELKFNEPFTRSINISCEF